ncbi:type III secretion system stator protein SctL [Paraburkholderia sp. CI3]|uniref:type III secretion system stator protein SctL n=1 Tax=Paraburkholderia sp. CI3 TaxID=2991060 RepID=UPI003D21714C
MRLEEFGHAVELHEAYAQLERDRHQVLQLAEEQAAAIVDEAEHEAGRVRDEAQRLYDDAVQRGFADGQQGAVEEWHKRNLDAMSEARAVQARMRERLAELVTSAVEQIVLAERPQALFERALTTLDKISEGASYLRISVSTDDYEDAVRTFASLADAGPRRLAIEVTPDKRLGPGACICESDYGVVDASLETQLQAIRSAVGRALKHSLANEGAGARPAFDEHAMGELADDDDTVGTDNEDYDRSGIRNVGEDDTAGVDKYDDDGADEFDAGDYEDDDAEADYDSMDYDAHEEEVRR